MTTSPHPTTSARAGGPASHAADATAPPPATPPMAPGDQAPEGTPGTGETVCPDCGGSGQAAGGADCPTCEGRGTVVAGIGGA